MKDKDKAIDKFEGISHFNITLFKCYQGLFLLVPLKTGTALGLLWLTFDWFILEYDLSRAAEPDPF